MTRRSTPQLLVALACTILMLTGCSRTKPSRTPVSMNVLPPVILWAWERTEDLTFLDPERYGVAFLAQTLILNGNEILFRPRRQPLKVSPGTKLVAVTRIESSKTTGLEDRALGDKQAEKLVALILRTQQLDNVASDSNRF